MDEKLLKQLAEYHSVWDKYNASLPEAGGIAFCTIYWAGTQINLTSRSLSPYSALEALLTGMQLAQETLGIVLEAPPLPVAQTQIQERDEAGLPVVDADLKPVMINLPPNTGLYTVKGFYHGTDKTGAKHYLKVVVEEKPYNTKYGHICFHPPFTEWKAWPVASDPPGLFAPPDKCKHVIIRNPEKEGGYPEIVEFRD